MSQNSQIDEFETYLQGKTDLSQLYADAPQVGLPDHLDAAILAEAHRAVNARPGAKPKRRWTIPLGLVASLFVVVMIGLQLPYMLKEARLSQLQKNETKAVSSTDKSMAESASAAPAGHRERQTQVMEKPKSEFTHSEPAQMAAAPAMPAKQNAPVVAAPQESLTAGNRPLGAASVAAPAPATAPIPAPEIAAKRFELRERADIDNGVALSQEKKLSRQVGGDSLERRAPAATGMAATEAVQPYRSMMQPSAEEAGDSSLLRPEDWLIRIQRLKQQGKLDEAKRELAAFKKRYPDYRIPEAFSDIQQK